MKDSLLIKEAEAREWLNNMGRINFRKLAEAAGSVVIISNRRYYNKKKIEEYIDGISGSGIDEVAPGCDCNKNEGSKEND